MQTNDCVYAQDEYGDEEGNETHNGLQHMKVNNSNLLAHNKEEQSVTGTKRLSNTHITSSPPRKRVKTETVTSNFFCSITACLC